MLSFALLFRPLVPCRCRIASTVLVLVQIYSVHCPMPLTFFLFCLRLAARRVLCPRQMPVLN